MRKKIPLMVNEPYKSKLEQSANVILEKIGLLKMLCQNEFNIEFENTDSTIEFIQKYRLESDIDSIKKQDELLHIKFEKEISKLMEDYPNIIKKKALEMFCSNTNREHSKEIIQYAVSINKGIKSFNLSNLDLECFVLNDEFIYNSKIDSRLKELYTTFCKSKKQVELKDLAEKLSDIVKLSIKVGLISDLAIGINIENIIDINTGKVKYNRIAVMQ